MTVTISRLYDNYADAQRAVTRLVSVAKYISPFKLRVFTLVFRAIFLAAYMCMVSTYFI